FIPLGTRVRTYAVRFYTSLSNVPSGKEIPFYLQDTLGGGNSLEGLEEYRFRDKDVLFIGNEYRWEPAPWLEMAVFYDVGKVFHDTSDFDLNALHKGYGGGVRFKLPQTTLLRLDYGASDQDRLLYLKFGASF